MSQQKFKNYIKWQNSKIKKKLNIKLLILLPGTLQEKCQSSTLTGDDQLGDGGVGWKTGCVLLGLLELRFFFTVW